MIDRGSTGSKADDQTTPPIQEAVHPNSARQTSTESIGPTGLALVSAIVIALLGVVFYGLNAPTRTGGTAPAPSSAASASNSGVPTPPPSGNHSSS